MYSDMSIRTMASCTVTLLSQHSVNLAHTGHPSFHLSILDCLNTEKPQLMTPNGQNHHRAVMHLTQDSCSTEYSAVGFEVNSTHDCVMQSGQLQQCKQRGQSAMLINPGDDVAVSGSFGISVESLHSAKQCQCGNVSAQHAPTRAHSCLAMQQTTDFKKPQCSATD